MAASLVVCVPETAKLAQESVGLSQTKTAKIVCLGKNDCGALDILPLILNSEDTASPEPHKSLKPKEEVSVIFWTSGTTGRRCVVVKY